MSSPSQIFWFLLDPWLFMAQSLSRLPQTILHLHSSGTLLTALLHPSRLQSAWFGTFWATAGPSVRDTASARVIPLLEGSVANGQVVVASDNDDAVEKPGISGTVLEVGPGTGMWLPLFSRLHLSGRARITRIYGVEPNTDVHAALGLSVAAAGLEDTYEIVPLGVEDLAGSGRVARESVDCIVSILCLCGIPDPEFNIREMYGYLKPGGRWFVYEHVRCGSEGMRECGLFMKVYQRFLNIIWPHFLGGCQLCRNTPKMLREAGPWTKIDLGQPESEPWYHPLPHILGTLTK
ncbi:Methyltransferase-like protein 7B [Cytospora mali]|uniref:Methyltransferase-like protein 7B n=1 Tax=Cytospora mali TaxID=578113 RepID=A0A194VD98_CYTMA|nr:Methyltransferase-like protein 7B [Valsa mali var. pyri (nom. inval.)]